MTILSRLTIYVKKVFMTTLDVFLDALRHSPNAQGYVNGSITELLLKNTLENEYNFEVKRIREKWEGKKHARHHGDFYFRKPRSPYWYVIESKGVKSNSEKWHKLYNFKSLTKFLVSHSDKIPWITKGGDAEQEITKWIYAQLPKFKDMFSSTLYDYEEVVKYKSARKSDKHKAINDLKDCTRDQINDMIGERLSYVMSKVKVLETHFVSGTSASGDRTQATPRKDEFNIIAIDIALRYSEHKFLYANPYNLDSSGGDADHLQQNYIMGFAFTDENGNISLSISGEWYDNINDLFELLDDDECVSEVDMQIDNRYLVAGEDNE